MYIGWDIGIKNLAYCLIKKVIIPDDVLSDLDRDKYLNTLDNVLVFGNNYYQIKGWDVLNIVVNVNDKQLIKGEITLSQRPELKCKANKIPSGKVDGGGVSGDNLCNKKAIVCANKMVNNEYVGYCSHHLKRSELGLDDYVDSKLNVCVCHIWDLKGNSRCCTKAVYLDKEHHYLGYCKKHYNEKLKTCGDMAFIKILKEKKASSIGLTLLADSLYDELDKYPDILDAKIVLLENQPVLKNPTMKSVQMFLYSYYVMKGYRDKAKMVNTIQCYMASKKLDIIKLMDAKVFKDIKDEVKNIKSQYSRNKKMAIRLTDNILLSRSINCNKYIELFNNSKKQDDLSDSLLMTLHYLEKDILSKIKVQPIINK